MVCAEEVYPGEGEKRRRAVAHLDLDAFFASVEVLEHPELANKPLVVGGRPGERGVVATASYQARVHGIHSAMSMSEAVRLCPNLVIVSPHPELYGRYSRRVMTLVRSAAPLVQQVSVDEAYLEWTDAIAVWDEAVELARELQVRVREETGLSASLGVSTNKLVAKVASDQDKPGGLTVVHPGEERAFLAPLPVRVLWGVGPKTAEKLRGLGVLTVGGLLKEDKKDRLWRAFGRRTGALLRQAEGSDDRPLVTRRKAKSVSQERTFVRDIAQPDELQDRLREMSRGVAARLQRASLTAGTVAIKVRYSDFDTLTRQTRLIVPTDDADKIERTALALLDRAWERGRPVRLLGVAARHLVSRSGQMALW